MSAWTKQCVVAVGASILRAPLGATVSKATNSHLTTFAKVTVSQKISPTCLTSHIKVTALWIVLFITSTEALLAPLKVSKKGYRESVVISESPYFSLCIFSPDVDECVLQGVCLNGRCVNLDGTHRCTCNHGYRVTSDSKACEGLQRIS